MIRVDGMVATPSRTQSITPNMNKRIAQPYSRSLRKKDVVVLDRRETPDRHRGRSTNGQCYNRITSHKIAGEVEPPITRHNDDIFAIVQWA